eukprot:6190684-Pleurochrysis_carterae.AAC.2
MILKRLQLVPTEQGSPIVLAACAEGSHLGLELGPARARATATARATREADARANDVVPAEASHPAARPRTMAAAAAPADAAAAAAVVAAAAVTAAVVIVVAAAAPLEAERAAAADAGVVGVVGLVGVVGVVGIGGGVGPGGAVGVSGVGVDPWGVGVAHPQAAADEEGFDLEAERAAKSAEDFVEIHRPDALVLTPPTLMLMPVTMKMTMVFAILTAREPRTPRAGPDLGVHALHDVLDALLGALAVRLLLAVVAVVGRIAAAVAGT